jgi:hypothetical protein
MSARTRVRMETTDIPLDGGEVLRVGLEFDRWERARFVHLFVGHGAGKQWREQVPGFALSVPHDRLPDLVRALLPMLSSGR